MKKLVGLLLIPYIYFHAQMSVDEVKEKIAEMQKEMIRNDALR